MSDLVVGTAFFIILLSLLTGAVWCVFSIRHIDLEFGYFARIWSMQTLNRYYDALEEGFPDDLLPDVMHQNVDTAVKHLKKYGVPDQYGAVLYRVDKDL